MKWLGYIWRVLVNLIYLAIVGAVLIGIRDPTEKSVVAVLGMLYVTIRSVGIGQALSTMGLAAGLQSQIDQIRYHVDGTFEIPDRSDEYAMIDMMKVKIYIDSFFLAFVSLACLAAFFTAHP